MPEPKELAVIIVSWRVKTQLRDCLESIYALAEPQQPGEVFVVDNHSNDGTNEMLKADFRQVKLIANQENLGFAKANNHALAQTQKPFIFFLNPDTKVTEGAFARMLQVFERHERAGIVGPKLLNPDNSLQKSVRNLPTPLALVAIFLKMRFWWPNFPPLKKYLQIDFDYDREQSVGQVMGAAFLVRRKVFEEIGNLDEKFWIWFEEVDFCMRAKNADWETWYTPEAKIFHTGGESFSRQSSFRKQRQWFASVLKYSQKHFNYFSTFCLFVFGVFSLLGTGTVQLCQKIIARPAKVGSLQL
ncbi:glycosyltransferase family 2 protein [Candidatus Parcubacteria bacterium]|nr:MAG: glycosyltransferase family 2 protein [Candidatus Parcubacteria bacterium]